MSPNCLDIPCSFCLPDFCVVSLKCLFNSSICCNLFILKSSIFFLVRLNLSFVVFVLICSISKSLISKYILKKIGIVIINNESNTSLNSRSLSLITICSSAAAI